MDDDDREKSEDHDEYDFPGPYLIDLHTLLAGVDFNEAIMYEDENGEIDD